MKRIVLSALLVMSTLTVGTLAYAQQSATGEVVSVRLLGRTMTVREAGSQEGVRYDVPRDATITVAGAEARLGLLRSGDQVTITYSDAGDSRRATRIRVPQPTSAMDQRTVEGDVSTITGRVERVDARNRTMTIRGDQSGRSFTYSVPEGSTLTLAGREARLGQFRMGDQVVMRFVGNDDQRQATRVRVPAPNPPLAQRPVPPPQGAAAQQTPARAQLPRTASDTPWLAVYAFLALLIAAAMRFATVARRNTENS